jgi:hypothetical protein
LYGSVSSINGSFRLQKVKPVRKEIVIPSKQEVRNKLTKSRVVFTEDGKVVEKTTKRKGKSPKKVNGHML